MDEATGSGSILVLRCFLVEVVADLALGAFLTGGSRRGITELYPRRTAGTMGRVGRVTEADVEGMGARTEGVLMGSLENEWSIGLATADVAVVEVGEAADEEGPAVGERAKEEA